MQVIDVDSNVTVVKGLEGSAFRVDLLADGSHSFEFNRATVKFAAPNGKFSRPGKETILARCFWDLDRRLEDLDRDGISAAGPDLLQRARILRCGQSGSDRDRAQVERRTGRDDC